MSQGGALIKNTLIIAVGKLSTQFLTFLLLPLYTILLSPDAYGRFDLAIVYLGLLAPTLTVQMEMAVFRHLIDTRQKESIRAGVVSSSFAVVVAGMLIGVVLIGLAGWMTGMSLTAFISGAFAAIVLANFFLQVARGIGRNDIFALGSIIIGLTNIVLSVLALTVFHASVEGLLSALITANIVGAAFLFTKTQSRKYINIRHVEKGTIKTLVAYSWPLVPNHISLWGITGVSRTIVAIILGLAAAGIFAAASKFTLIYTSLYSVFAMSWTESASLYVGKKGDFLSNATNSTVKLFGSLALLIISASAVVFPLLVSIDFAEAKYYIPILIIGGFFASIVTHYGAIYLAVKETKKIATVAFQALIVSSILTLVGIWYIGLYAPAIAVAVTYIYIAIRRHCDVQRFVKIKYSTSTFVPIMIVAVFVLICYYIDNRVLNVVSFILTAIAMALVNKDDLYKIKNIILKKGR